MSRLSWEESGSVVENAWHMPYLGEGSSQGCPPTSLPPHLPSRQGLPCSALSAWLSVAFFQDLLSAPGPYKGSFDAKFEGK